MLPPLTLLFCGDVIANFARGSGYASDFPLPLAIYFSICLLSWVALGVPWLIWRPIFGIESVRTKRKLEVIDVEAILGRPLGLTSKCRFEAKIPLNQIFDLAIEELELPVHGLPPALDGYRIAHLSDIHLTGHVHPDFSRYAVERATKWQPHLMALTGDIIALQSPCPNQSRDR